MGITTICTGTAARLGDAARHASSSLSSTSSKAYNTVVNEEDSSSKLYAALCSNADALPLALADQALMDARSRNIVSKAQAGHVLATPEVAHILDKASKWNTSGSPRLQALISSSPPSSPPGGSLFLVNRAQAPHYMADGHSWKRKERHMNLKVGGKDKVNCYYATPGDRASPQGPSLQRRRYWLLYRKDLVLLHYWEQPRSKAGKRDEAEAGSMPSQLLDAAGAHAAATGGLLEASPCGSALVCWRTRASTLP